MNFVASNFLPYKKQLLLLLLLELLLNVLFTNLNFGILFLYSDFSSKIGTATTAAASATLIL